MTLTSLLLSRDDQIIRMLRRVLNDLEVEVDVFTGSDKASEELARHKYDAVIIDCDDVHGAVDVLRNLRKTTSNKTSTAFAIINGVTSVRSAFEMGANLALEKPLTPDRARHSFRAVHGLMLQERRRYYRHPTDMAVTLQFEDAHTKVRKEVLATGVNLSEGGMAVKVKSSLPKGQTMARVKFILPASHDWVEISGAVAWADDSGHAGVRFENVPYTLKNMLDKWFRKADEDAKLKAPASRKSH